MHLSECPRRGGVPESTQHPTRQSRPQHPVSKLPHLTLHTRLLLVLLLVLLLLREASGRHRMGAHLHLPIHAHPSINAERQRRVQLGRRERGRTGGLERGLVNGRLQAVSVVCKCIAVRGVGGAGWSCRQTSWRRVHWSCRSVRWATSRLFWHLGLQLIP